MENIEFNERIVALERRIEKLELANSISNEDRLSTGLDSKKKVTINEFLKTKEIDDDVKRTLVIVYYLSYFGGPDVFNADDVKIAFRLAKFKIPKNVNDKININVRNGYLAEEREKKDSKKAWYITNSGAEFVEKELNK